MCYYAPQIIVAMRFFFFFFKFRLFVHLNWCVSLNKRHSLSASDKLHCTKQKYLSMPSNCYIHGFFGNHDFDTRVHTQVCGFSHAKRVSVTKSFVSQLYTHRHACSGPEIVNINTQDHIYKIKGHILWLEMKLWQYKMVCKHVHF